MTTLFTTPFRPTGPDDRNIRTAGLPPTPQPREAMLAYLYQSRTGRWPITTFRHKLDVASMAWAERELQRLLDAGQVVEDIDTGMLRRVLVGGDTVRFHSIYDEGTEGVSQREAAAHGREAAAAARLRDPRERRLAQLEAEIAKLR